MLCAHFTSGKVRVGVSEVHITPLVLVAVKPQAFDVFEELKINGVVPNTFTFTTLIEACNYRKGGHCHEVSAIDGSSMPKVCEVR